MKTLADIPEHIRTSLSPEVARAIELFTPDEAKELKAFFQLETGDFDCVGFIGPGGKVTKFTDPEKYKALLIIEEQVKLELSGKVSRLLT